MIDRICQRAATICLKLGNMGVTIKQKTQIVVKEFPRAMHDLYTLEGFEKCTKAVIANIKLLPHLFAIQGIFDECLKTLEAQKDLYYATQFINSICDFIHVNRQTGAMTWSRPKTNIRGAEVIDYGKIFTAIGSLFETCKFLQKQKIWAFTYCTRFANAFASVEIRGWKLDHIPVIQALSDKPKDIFVALSSAYEIRKILCNRSIQPILETENVLKGISSIGKIALIALGRQYYNYRFFAIIDFATQNASLVAYIYKRHNKRMERFNDPLGAAPAA